MRFPDTTFPMNETENTDELSKEERRRRREHAINLVRYQTVHNQPALISQGRLRRQEKRIANGRNDGMRGREYLDEGLKAAVENDKLICRTAPDETKYYGYACDVEYVRAVIEAVLEWDPVPKDLVGWCNMRIVELEGRQ